MKVKDAEQSRAFEILQNEHDRRVRLRLPPRRAQTPPGRIQRADYEQRASRFDFNQDSDL